ncbi:uncharacterized protein LOC142606256 [Castanea sativa]|uniref:uncharacterized protein LOC142606256 n=1 Tax=Castanea sativa TaxID=21020 RepID=UPI003F652545
MLLGCPWIHGNGIVPSTLHQCFKHLQSGIKKVNADLKPFAETEAHFANAKFYVEDDIPNEVLPVEISSMESKQVEKKHVRFITRKDIPSPKEDLEYGNDHSSESTNALLTPKEGEGYLKRVEEYKDVFGWTYKEMPRLNPSIALHHLAVKKSVRPVKQAQRCFRSKLIPQIETKVNKLIEASFIYEVQYPEWIAKIVLVKKKNGQIRVCVDFRDLNNACPKDDFPLPITEVMVDATTGHEALSFIDGSSGYNQIQMNPKDEELIILLKVFTITKFMKKDVHFKWDEACSNAFASIKRYLLNPPVLGAPIPGKCLVLYIAAQEKSLSALMAQENEEGKEKAPYYLSQTLNGAELNYSPIKKTCLALFFTIDKLKHYIQAYTVHLIAKADLIKYVLSRLVVLCCIARWAVLLQQYDLAYVPQKAVKGHALADFLADHPVSSDCEFSNDFPDKDVFYIEVMPLWMMFFDGATCQEGAGASVVFVSPQRQILLYLFSLSELCSNNVAEYQALIIGLQMTIEMGISQLEIFGDSKLIINQILE